MLTFLTIFHLSRAFKSYNWKTPPFFFIHPTPPSSFETYWPIYGAKGRKPTSPFPPTPFLVISRLPPCLQVLDKKGIFPTSLRKVTLPNIQQYVGLCSASMIFHFLNGNFQAALLPNNFYPCLQPLLTPIHPRTIPLSRCKFTLSPSYFSSSNPPPHPTPESCQKEFFFF